MQNTEFYQTVKNLTLTSLEILKKENISELKFLPDSKWIKQDKAVYIRQERKQPLWNLILLKVKDEIESSEAYSRLIELINKDKIIASQINNPVGTCMGQKTFKLRRITDSLLYLFLKETGVLNFDESLFNAKYLQIENELYSKEILFERITPLRGFSTDTDNL
jgi:hypothetical protein